MEERLDAALDRILKRAWPKLLERLDLLRTALAHLEAGTLGPELRHAAHTVAHQLTGTLGIFGWREAGHCARRIEAGLDREDPDLADMKLALAELSAHLER